MLFKKKNKKLDSKVRFQHKQFTGKLVTARNYKRTALAIPETKLEKFLTKIGLGSKLTQIGLGIIILALIYVIYLPNFLTVETITINGLSESQARDFEIAIRDEIAGSSFFYPEKNLLFLRNKVVYNALAKVPSVANVATIYKTISKQELTIEAESKYEKYLVSTPEKVYDVFNDGVFKGEAGVQQDLWLGLVNPAMIKIQIPGEVSANKFEQFFHADLTNYLDSLNARLTQVPNVKVAYYKFEQAKQVEITPTDVLTDADSSTVEEISEQEKPEPIQISLPINSAEVHAVIYKNNSQNTYRVIFDATKDVQKSIDNLKLLLSQTAPDRYAQLSYVDLRLEERAYLCLQNTPCDK
jgi:hypothetical protein